MTKDWLRWHAYYDHPDSSLAERLEAVRHDLRAALSGAPGDGVVRVLSICAGEGRDVLPVLAERNQDRPVHATLIELDPVLAGRAVATAADLRLADVAVKNADAGLIDTYLDMPKAHVLLACGIFGNISDADVRRTIAALPALLADEGIVIWTRGWTRKGHNPDRDPGPGIRACFAEHSLLEMSFTRTSDDVFRIGMNRLAKRADAGLPQPGTRLFAFA